MKCSDARTFRFENSILAPRNTSSELRNMEIGKDILVTIAGLNYPSQVGSSRLVRIPLTDISFRESKSQRSRSEMLVSKEKKKKGTEGRSRKKYNTTRPSLPPLNRTRTDGVSSVPSSLPSLP